MAQEVPRRSHGHRPTFSGVTRNSTVASRAHRRLTGLVPAGILKKMPHEVPNPSHRHGTPSGPWPFLDLHVLVKEEEALEPEAVKNCTHKHPDDEPCWCRYPQSLYPNWTNVQQKASRIIEAKDDKSGWNIYPVVVNNKGIFHASQPLRSTEQEKLDEFWNEFRLPKEEISGSRVHALFVDNMAGSVMQMLGTKYNIEPFFFSSSFGWIPTQYQENVTLGESDHITITLTFVRCINDPFNPSHEPVGPLDMENKENNQARRNVAIKTNEYLWLESSNQLLFSDIISLHMIRDPKDGNTIISYHAHAKFRATTAKQLRDRFRLTGRSVYWSQIFERSKDPTFTFLSLLWYALYAWDESLEALYNHLCALESKVLEDNDLDFTQELHRIRAHLLHYASLLEDFIKTVNFVKDTHHPALDNPAYFTPKESQDSKNLMEQECTNLLNQIQRLELTRRMQDKRLTNVMQLGFSTVNIEDSKRMHRLTEAAVRDSAAMKQIAYLTMFFLPASFVATAFGMNVSEINDSIPTLSNYLATALPLTAVTIWIVVALQIQIEDKPSRRHRRYHHSAQKSESPRQVAKDILQSPTTTEHPHGHNFRRAYTTAGGDILVHDNRYARSGVSGEHELDDDYDDEYDKAENDNDVYDTHRRRYDEFKNSSLWKRLAWPVSLTYAVYTNWQEGRQKRTGQRPRPNPPQTVETDNMQGGRTNRMRPILPRFFRRNNGGSGAMTPAERYAEDVRSQHSASKLRTPESDTSFPKSILKGKEKAADTVLPVEPDETFIT